MIRISRRGLRPIRILAHAPLFVRIMAHVPLLIRIRAFTPFLVGILDPVRIAVLSHGCSSASQSKGYGTTGHECADGREERAPTPSAFRGDLIVHQGTP